MRNCNDQQKQAGNVDASSHSTVRAAAAIICGKPKDLKLTKTTACEGKLTAEETWPEAKWGKS